MVNPVIQIVSERGYRRVALSLVYSDSVDPTLGNDPTYPTSRIVHISIASWNEMNVRVHNRLASVFPTITPDVEAGDLLVLGH